jgi:hypothetical protein
LAEFVRFRAVPSPAFAALQAVIVEIKRVKDQDDLDEPPAHVLEHELGLLRAVVPLATTRLTL